AVMTMPLVILAVCAVLLGFIGTPAWPWFQHYLSGHEAHGESSAVPLMILSSLIVFAGVGLGWYFYGRKPIERAEAMDVLEQREPGFFGLLRNKFYVDEFYDATVIRFHAWAGSFTDCVDRAFLSGIV